MTFPKTNLRQRSLILVVVGVVFAGCSVENKRAQIDIEEGPKIQFAAAEIVSALGEKGIQTYEVARENADIDIVVNIAEPGLKPEGFTIDPRDKILVTSADAVGAMYGRLELAEQIKLHGIKGVKETKQNPYMEMRGTKFYFPLGVRTPSYTDP